MNQIAKHLERTKQTQAEFARSIGVTQGAVYQYIAGLRPVSEKVCVRIEEATAGALSRKMLRPDDWADIWPELKVPEHA